MIDYILLEKFWNYLYNNTQKDSQEAYIEIRLLSPSSNVYNTVKNIKHLPTKNNCQIFIKNFAELKYLFILNDGVLYKESKMCYALQPKYMLNGEINGSYDCITNVHKIYFDIEKSDHSQMTESEKQLCLHKYIYNTVIPYLEQFGLIEYVIIDSGNGYHLIYNIMPQRITDARRRYYKEFIEKVHKVLSNEMFKIDPLKDFTRVTAMPESLHPRLKCKVRILEMKDGINSIKLGSKRERKNIFDSTEKEIDFKNKRIKDCLSFQVAIRDPPSGFERNRHDNITFSLRLALKAMEYNEYEKVEKYIEQKTGNKLILTPTNGTNGKYYNKGIMINYLRENINWAKEHFPDWEDEKYW